MSNFKEHGFELSKTLTISDMHYALQFMREKAAVLAQKRESMAQQYLGAGIVLPKEIVDEFLALGQEIQELRIKIETYETFLLRSIDETITG
jgi:hypothetical protein